MRAVAESAGRLGEELEGTNNVLLLAPAMGPADGEACSGLLSTVPEDRAAVVCVTFNQTPDDRLEQWRAGGGPTDPAKLAFVVAGEGVRSATVATSIREASDGLGPTVVAVSSPGDLTGLGIKISDFFTDWADDDQLLLCFHTLTTCLQYVDLRTAYRFVHVLTGKVRSVDAIAHFHLDPTAHEERTVNTLLTLFDAVVREAGDGAWEVRRRR